MSTKMIRKRIRLSQNFFRDSNLVRSIVSGSSIAETDLVYEIGPGEGIVTRELAKAVAKVIAIEKDPELASLLKSMFKDLQNVEVYEADFLKYDIKESDYKIFSNIPFNITSEIVKKILYIKNPPKDAYLVMQEEAANKFYGYPHETEFSIFVKPWFDINVVRKFRRTDFVPIPAVDVVLLNVRKREEPWVSSDNTMNYRRFVKYGYEAWKKSLRKTYEKIFTYEQWKRMSRDLGFPMDATPTQLTCEQWLGLFERFLKIVPASKQWGEAIHLSMENRTMFYSPVLGHWRVKKWAGKSAKSFIYDGGSFMAAFEHLLGAHAAEHSPRAAGGDGVAESQSDKPAGG